MSTRYQNYINTEETEQAKPDGLIDTRYTGLISGIKGKKGKAYYILAEDMWYFTATGDTEQYRVKAESLDFEK